MYCVGGIRTFSPIFVIFCFVSFQFLFSGCGSPSSGGSPSALISPFPSPNSIPVGITGPGAGTTTTVTNLLTLEQQEMLDKINALRTSQGLGPLQVDVHLQNAAQKHSDYMDLNDILSHSEPAPNNACWDRIANNGGSFNASGEIIACGNEDAASTFLQWYNSSGHLAIMLGSQYQFIGIVRSGTSSEVNTHSCPWYWTADFGGN